MLEKAHSEAVTQGGVGWVAHGKLVTAQRQFFGFVSALDFGLALGLGLVDNSSLMSSSHVQSHCPKIPQAQPSGNPDMSFSSP